MEGFFKNDDLFNTSISSLYDGKEAPGFDIFSGDTWIYPTNYPVRDYQYEIVEKALFKNSLICLPTGMGKTFIAAVIMYNFYRWYPTGKIIFLAPTKPLVTQQIESCFNVMGIPPDDTSEMTGVAIPANKRAFNWKTKRVFFLTPQILVNDISSAICPPDKIKCIVIDEAHKAQGNYAYCKIIELLRPYNKSYRILALSATPGSDIQAVQKVLKNLLISHIEIRHEASMELSKYTHEKKLEKIVVPLGKKLGTIKKQYLQVVEVFTNFLNRHNINLGNIEFLNKFRVLILKDNYLKANAQPDKMVIGTFFIVVTLTHGLELLELHGLHAFYNYFKEYINDPKTNPFALSRIQQTPGFTPLMKALESELNKTELNLMDPNVSFLPDINHTSSQEILYSHPKLEKLEEIAVEHFNTFKEKNTSTRIMIFCQYRISVFEVCYVLKRHHPLIKPMSFVGQNNTKNKQGISQREQIMIMTKFRQGGYNTLVCTSIAEEGLDIGEVDLIICFDSLASPVRLVQRMGRTGRKREGRVVMLITQGYEETKFEKGINKRNTINNLLGNSSKLNEFLFRENPRMVPNGIIPKCHRLNIELPEKNEQPCKKRKQNQIKNYFNKLNSTEQPLLSIPELLDLKKEANINFDQITSSKFLCTLPKDTLINEFLRDNDYSIGPNNYIEWQKDEQYSSLINHSSITQDLVSLFKLTETLKLNSLVKQKEEVENIKNNKDTNDLFQKVVNNNETKNNDFQNNPTLTNSNQTNVKEKISQQIEIIDLSDNSNDLFTNNSNSIYNKNDSPESNNTCDNTTSILKSLFISPNCKLLDFANSDNLTLSVPKKLELEEKIPIKYTVNFKSNSINCAKFNVLFPSFILHKNINNSYKIKKNKPPCKSFSIDQYKRDKLLKNLSKNNSISNLYKNIVQIIKNGKSINEITNENEIFNQMEIITLEKSREANNISSKDDTNISLNKLSDNDNHEDNLCFSQEEIDDLFNDPFFETPSKKEKDIEFKGKDIVLKSEKNISLKCKQKEKNDQVKVDEIILSQKEIKSLFEEPFSLEDQSTPPSLKKEEIKKDSLKITTNESQSFLKSFFENSNSLTNIKKNDHKTYNLNESKNLSSEEKDMFEDDPNDIFVISQENFDQIQKNDNKSNFKQENEFFDDSLDIFESPLNEKMEKSPIRNTENNVHLSTPLSNRKLLTETINCDLSPILLSTKNENRFNKFHKIDSEITPIKKNNDSKNVPKNLNSMNTDKNILIQERTNMSEEANPVKKRLNMEQKSQFTKSISEDEWDLEEIFSPSLLKVEKNKEDCEHSEPGSSLIEVVKHEENKEDCEHSEPGSSLIEVVKHEENEEDCEDSEPGSPNLLTNTNSFILENFISQKSQHFSKLKNNEIMKASETKSMVKDTDINDIIFKNETKNSNITNSKVYENIDIYHLDELMVNTQKSIDLEKEENKSDERICQQSSNKNNSKEDSSFSKDSDDEWFNSLDLNEIEIIEKKQSSQNENKSYKSISNSKNKCTENSFLEKNSFASNLSLSPSKFKNPKPSKRCSFLTSQVNPDRTLSSVDEDGANSKDLGNGNSYSENSFASNSSLSRSKYRKPKPSKRCTFLISQANPDRTFSSDDEDGASLDDLDSSFIDSDNENLDDSDLQKKFIHSIINKPPGKFKLGQIKPLTDDIFSQQVNNDDNSYEEDSFCVGDEEDEEQNNESILDVLEEKLKKRKRKNVQNEFTNKKRFKRIKLPSESDQMDTFCEDKSFIN